MCCMGPYGRAYTLKQWRFGFIPERHLCTKERTKQVLSAANRYNGLNSINVSDVFVLFGLAATIYFVINFSISMTVRNLQKKKMTVKVKKTPVLEERRQTGWAYNG